MANSTGLDDTTSCQRRDCVLNSLFTTLLYMAMIGVTFKHGLIGVYV